MVYREVHGSGSPLPQWSGILPASLEMTAALRAQSQRRCVPRHTQVPDPRALQARLTNTQGLCTVRKHSLSISTTEKTLKG